MSTFVRVASLADVPEFGGKVVNVAGREVVLFKTSDGVFAVDALCPHRGGPLLAAWREGESIFCPLHGWEFDLRTGHCRTDPTKPIRCYTVRVSGDEIEVGCEPNQNGGTPAPVNETENKKAAS